MPKWWLRVWRVDLIAPGSLALVGRRLQRPVHLSRDQNVELLMLSYLDISLIVGIPLLIALAFFFIGRPYWMQVIRHPSKYRELVYQNTSRDTAIKR